MTDATGPGTAAVGVELDLRQAQQHLIAVRLEFTPSQPTLRFSLPAWTPGSYLIRDYVRLLEGLELEQDAMVLEPRRCGVAAWTVELPSLAPVQIRYRLHAGELSVRTCHLDGDHGFLALAGVVLQLEGHRWCAHRLSLQLPPGWEPFVPLPQVEGPHWQAGDYDQLVDTPLELGPHPCHHFEVAGVPHRWVSWGGDLPVLDARWLASVEAVCLACCRLMGEARPASAAYLFVLHLRDQGFGGLEHDDASVLVYGRRALERPEGRRRLLQLVAHEYLHQWNVRRLRPAELCPIDYDRPVLVPTLWFAEGLTSYYDQLLPLAAGQSDEASLLEDLGADLSRYLLTPGRRVQSLRSSSLEAWVKLYRQDAWSADSQVSYYLKGAVVALVLDLHLRRQGSCLAEVLQELWQRFGRCRRGYREDDLLEAFIRRAPDLAELLPLWLQGHDDPDLQDYLADLGLRLQPQLASTADPGWQLEDPHPSGLRLRRVRRHGAACSAGLQVGDELLAADGQRLRTEEDLRPLLALSDSGKPRHPSIELLFCRDGRIRQCSLRPGPAAIERWRLSAEPDAPETALQRRLRWMHLQPEP